MRCSTRIGLFWSLASWLLSASLVMAGDSVQSPVPQAPADAKSELRAAIDLLKAHHMNRDSVNWPDITKEALTYLGIAKTPADAYPAIRLVIGRLGEKHTILIPAPTWTAVMAGDQSDAMATMLSKPPRSALLGDRIGLVAVPGYMESSDHDASYVASIRRILGRFEARGVCRFIVDLRGNAGGNLFPMLNGLVALLGHQPYGKFLLADAPEESWDLRSGWMSLSYEGIQPPPVSVLRPTAPVAVLLDHHTVSSGEFAAIAFEGRPTTEFFGEPTAGYVTVNSGYPLPDGARLLVSEGWATDRRGHPYHVAVVPDAETPSGTSTLDAAAHWLRAQPCLTKKKPASERSRQGLP